MLFSCLISELYLLCWTLFSKNDIWNYIFLFLFFGFSFFFYEEFRQTGSRHEIYLSSFQLKCKITHKNMLIIQILSPSALQLCSYDFAVNDAIIKWNQLHPLYKQIRHLIHMPYRPTLGCNIHESWRSSPPTNCNICKEIDLGVCTFILNHTPLNPNFYFHKISASNWIIFCGTGFNGYWLILPLSPT